MRALLDVNVLIALRDEAHIGHATATGWLRGAVGHGWASCPITQNGGTIDWPRVLGHRQVTDHDLLALAVRHHGRFITFHARIAAQAVPGAGTEHLVTL